MLFFVYAQIRQSHGREFPCKVLKGKTVIDRAKAAISTKGITEKQVHSTFFHPVVLVLQQMPGIRHK
jgi:hypothetical protein